MAGLMDIIQAILGQQQAPSGASASPGGGVFATPGSFMQTLGVPLSILGNVEAARRKPVGAAYLSGIGQLLGDLGQQRQQFYTKSQDFNEALKIAQDRGILGKGLKSTISDLQQAAITDPDFASKQLEDITKFFETQQSKEDKGVDDRDAIAQQLYGVKWNALTTKDQRKAVNDALKEFKAKASGNKPPTNAEEQKLLEGGIDPNKATPAQWAWAHQALRNEKNQDALTRMKEAASLGVTQQYDPDTGEIMYGRRINAPGTIAKPGPAPHVSDGYMWSPVPELGPGTELGTAMPPNTLEGKGLELFGSGPGPILNYRGTPIKPTMKTKNGRRIPVYTLPDGRTWTP